MRHLHHFVLAAVAVTLSVTPVAGAHGHHADGRGAVVAPAKAKWLNEFWVQLYSLPVSENPFAGNGNPCMTVGHKVITDLGGQCTIDQGTALMVGLGTVWSNVEDPFPETEAEQRAISLDIDEASLREIHVIVDGGTPVDIRMPRFEVFPRQRTVELPADNILGVSAQTATFTGHSWSAVVRKLRPGQHTIIVDVVFADGEQVSFPHVITVVPRHADHGDD